MHEPIRLPSSQHHRISPRTFVHQLQSPRLRVLAIHILEFEDSLGYPQAQRPECIVVGDLLSTTDYKHPLWRVQGLEVANSDEGRGDSGHDRSRLVLLSNDFKVGETDESKRAGGWDAEGMHC